MRCIEIEGKENFVAETRDAIKRLRGRRVRARKRLLEKGDRVTKVKANTSVIVTNHQRKM